MLLVEPTEVFTRRMPRQYAEAWQAWPRQETDLGIPVDEIWVEEIYHFLQANNCAPIRITSLINDLAKFSGYRSRPEREAKKVKLLKLITRLFRLGAIKRVNRCYVAIPKPDDPRYRAFVELATMPLNLPSPQV